MNNDVSLAAAFLAGLVSFLPPCVLPLVPGYISMLSGIGVEQLRQGQTPRAGLFASSLAFVVGFSVVFISFGASASAVGTFLRQHRALLAPIAGAFILLFGLHLVGLLIKLTVRAGLLSGAVLAALGVLALVRGGSLFAGLGAVHFFSLALIGFLGPSMARWLNRDVHLRNSASQPGVWSAFFLGFAFAFGWSPCLGAIGGGVLGLASPRGTVARGILLLAVYSAGLSVPFLLTALELTRFLKFYQRFRKYLHVVEFFSGALLPPLGCLVFFNRLTWLTGKLIFLSAITAWLERPFAAAQHSWTFWLLVALSFIAVAVLALIRYREVFASMQGKKTIAVLLTVLGFIALTIFADRATRVHNGNASAIPVANAASIKPAPDIRLKDLDGKAVSLADYKGKVVFVNFWATWCDPCRVEIPCLLEMQQKYGSKGFTVLGVAMDEEGKSVVAPFVAKEQFDVSGRKSTMSYPIVLGNDDIAEKFGGLLGYPTSILISRDGKQVKRITGLISYEEIS